MQRKSETIKRKNEKKKKEESDCFYDVIKLTTKNCFRLFNNLLKIIYFKNIYLVRNHLFRSIFEQQLLFNQSFKNVLTYIFYRSTLQTHFLAFRR